MPRIRSILFRFAHTGELAALPGQLAAGLGCLAGMLLVWIAWSLTIRRLASSQRVRRGPRLTEAAAR